MSKTVAILGCGPTGLLCAWAVEQAGHTPYIVSRKVKSQIPGSQHLHGPIPGLTSPYPEGTIQFIRIGSAEVYARKVYGDAARETGWDNYLQVYPSWNVLNAYDRLWDHFRDDIQDYTFEYTVSDFDDLLEDHDAVISTIPARFLCLKIGEHQFAGQQYWIKTLPTPEADRDHEIVVYNGLKSDPWYRWSILGGLCSIETTQWSATDDDYQEGVKAVSNNCDCFPSIHRCGRWAEWTHGVTMYKAYQKAEQIAREL